MRGRPIAAETVTLMSLAWSITCTLLGLIIPINGSAFAPVLLGAFAASLLLITKPIVNRKHFKHADLIAATGTFLRRVLIVELAICVLGVATLTLSGHPAIAGSFLLFSCLGLLVLGLTLRNHQSWEIAHIVEQ